MLFLLGTVLIVGGLAFADMTDKATLGGQSTTRGVYDWRVTSTGDLVPGTANQNNIGSAALPVAAIYVTNSNATYTGATVSGAMTVGTTLGVSGVSTLAGIVDTAAATVGTTLGVTGIQTSTGVIYANGGIDRSTAAGLAIGAAHANAVTITPATTITGAATLSSTLAVTGAQTLTGATYANGGVDRSTAAALAIGATNATVVNVTPPAVFLSTVKGPGTQGYGTYTIRQRIPIASVNSGVTLVAAVTGRKIRVIDAEVVAYSGAVTSSTATGVAITGTQTSPVALFTIAKAQLTESALNHFGTASTTLLADGASLIANDAATAITFAAVGGTDLAGATGIDVILTYTIE